MAQLKVKDGVNIHGLLPEMQPVLVHSHRIWSARGYDHVVTSARDGIHGIGSWHYFGYALDLRTWAPEGGQLNLAEKQELAEELREALSQYSDFYDVVVESTHMHIEYDWLRSKRG
jgi:hypothetical protein